MSSREHLGEFEQIVLLASRLVDKEVPDLEVILNSAAAKGMASSSHTVIQRHERRFATLEALLAERIRLEREYPMAPEDDETWWFPLSAQTFGKAALRSARSRLQAPPRVRFRPVPSGHRGKDQ